VAEGDSKGGVVDVQPARRIRPHWWVVLAVSVSLLALVAAHAGRPAAPGRSAAAPRASANHDRIAPTAPAPTTTTTTEPGPGPTVTPPTSPSSTPATDPTAGVRVVVRETSPTATTTTTTTTTTTVTTVGPSVAAPVQTVPPTVYNGALQQPDDASASHPFTGSGAMVVTASSTSTAALLLTVTCPAGTQDNAGSSLVSVVIPDADGPCDVVLKETTVQYVAVPYTLTIGPEGG
jgi:hypothetical protein